MNEALEAGKAGSIMESSVRTEYYTRVSLMCLDALLIGWNLLRILGSIGPSTGRGRRAWAATAQSDCARAFAARSITHPADDVFLKSSEL